MGKEFGSVKIQTESEEALAFKVLFPAKNKLQHLQMITEIPNRLRVPMAVMRVPMAVMGVIRRLYASTGNIDAIQTFEEEFYVLGLPIDRKSRLEASEIVAAVRRKRDDDED